MNILRTGVPLLGTPIFFWALMLAACPLLAAGAAAAPRTEAQARIVEARGATLTAGEKAVLTADYIRYEDAAGRISAQGNVRLWYRAMTVTADAMDSDLAGRLLHARGHVNMIEPGRSVQCADLDYNLKTGSARRRGILFASPPWFYQGETVEKNGEHEVVIEDSSFTTCNARRPHFHLTAGRIDIELGESLTAYNVVLYVGTTPLFYFPWFQRSLKDSRSPFSFKVGYDDFEGFFTKLRLSYWLWDKNDGVLRLDLMERKGVGAGLNQHLQYELLGRGDGKFSAYYVKDKELNRERWTGNFSNRHEITPQDLLQLNLDYISDHTFNREFSSSLVDTFQQKSYLAYSHQGNGYFFGMGAQEVNSYVPARGAYFPYTRELPNLNFSLSSFQIARLLNPVYFSFNSSLRRFYQQSTPGENITYQNQFSLAPALTETYSLPPWVATQPSLSATLSLPLNGSYVETPLDPLAANPRGSAAYSTNLTLTNKWVNYQKTNPTHLVESRLTHDFTRGFNLPASPLANAGVTANHAGLALDYNMGNRLRLQNQTGYNFLAAPPDGDWKQRLDPWSLSGWAGLSADTSLNWQGTYNWTQARFTAGYLAAGCYQKDWSLSVNGSYSFSESAANPHSLFTTVNGRFSPWDGLDLQSDLQYNFTMHQLDRITLGVSQDLHCWVLQASYSYYSDGKSDIGLGITLKAFPAFRAGMGGLGGMTLGN